jgi:hypothetical protein
MFTFSAGAVGSPVAGSVANHTAESNGTACWSRLDAAMNTSMTLGACARSISAWRP